MLFPLTAKALCLAALVSASAIPNTHRLHEKRDVSSYSASSSLIKRGRIHSRTVLPMRVGLKQPNLDDAPAWLEEISHPSSTKYGQFWTADEVVAAFQPAQESVDDVLEWLTGVGGIARARITHSDNKAWLAFDATAEEAEYLLHTTYHTYEHPATGDAYLGSDEYHVPHKVQKHIDYITPGVKGLELKKRTLPKRQTPKPSPVKKWVPIEPSTKPCSPLKDCDTYATPDCIEALYDFPKADPDTAVSPNNSMGFFEKTDYYDQYDLDAYFTNFTSGKFSIPNGTHPILNAIDGAYPPPLPTQFGGAESTADLELAYGIIYPQTLTLYQTDDGFYSSANSTRPFGLFNDFLDALDGSYCTYCAYGECGNDPEIDPVYPDLNATNFNFTSVAYNGTLQCGVFKPTNVISLSYGAPENFFPESYVKRQCNEFLKLGLQGVTVLFASGDSGVGQRVPGETCLGPNQNVFTPNTGASCPWLTSVGATALQKGKTVYDGEVAANDPPGDPFPEPFATGGGFSNYFQMPAYQTGYLEEYFNRSKLAGTYPYYYDGNFLNATNGGVYNRNGRGIPDVSALGNGIAIYTAGDLISQGGTSLSAPIFGSLINRIIEERIRIGKGPLGFINPTLYANPGMFNDITSGTNPGCNVTGFDAVEGWDPLTGLGTPKYPELLRTFLALP